MSFDFSTLITDRSQVDVSFLSNLMSKNINEWTSEELDQFNNGLLKGGYFWTDLNRVTACMDYLNLEFRSRGYETGYNPLVIHPIKTTSRLPEGYTELKSIKSDGAQYIDTGIKPNQDTRVVCKAILLTSASAAWLFGARNGSGSSTFGFLTYERKYRSDYNTDQDKYIQESYSGAFTVDKNKNRTFIDSVEKATSAYGAFQSNHSLALFANNSAGAVSGKARQRSYPVRYTKTGTPSPETMSRARTQTGLLVYMTLCQSHSTRGMEHSYQERLLYQKSLVVPKTCTFGIKRTIKPFPK